MASSPTTSLSCWPGPDKLNRKQARDERGRGFPPVCVCLRSSAADLDSSYGSWEKLPRRASRKVKASQRWSSSAYSAAWAPWKASYCATEPQ